MPQRFLKPGITTSKKWNALDWIGQSFYIRLITLVDDFGRYEADPILLRSHAFPRHDDITCKQVFALCEQLQTTGMVDFYSHPNGKEYLQMLNWHEKPRSSSRYPEKDGSCKQMFANANKCYPPSPSPSPSPQPYVASQPDEYTQEFKDFWTLYPRKVGKGAAWKAWKAMKPPHGTVLSAVSSQAKSKEWMKDGGQYIPHPSTWLNQRRWEDEGMTPVDRTSGPDLHLAHEAQNLQIVRERIRDGLPCPPEFLHLLDEAKRLEGVK